MDNKSSNQNIYIRDYAVRDLDEVVSLWYRTWHSSYPNLRHPNSIDEWRERFSSQILPQSTTFVAESTNKKIIGFMCIVDEENYLSQIFIDTTFQREGVGTLLMNKAKKVCPSKLSLHTLERNTQSRKFYEKHGFQEGEKSINPHNGYVNIWYHWHAVE